MASFSINPPAITPKTYMVYGRIDGRLACWEVDVDSHQEAISVVAKNIEGSRCRPLLAVIDGGRA